MITNESVVTVIATLFNRIRLFVWLFHCNLTVCHVNPT